MAFKVWARQQIGQCNDIEEWCRRCEICASRKPPPKHRHAPLRIDITGNPLQRVAMDILGPLPVTHQNNKFILVIGDYFTKWTEAYPIPNMEASTVARLFVNEFVAPLGAPETLHTNQGRNLESALIKEVCQLLGVTKTRITPYHHHPQSDRMVERFNRTLLSMLSTAIEDDERLGHKATISHAGILFQCS